MAETKICGRCKAEKPIVEFHKRNLTRCGYKSICKICDYEIARERYKEKREQILLKHKEWKDNNIEHRKEYNKQWKAENVDRVREQGKILYLKNIPKKKKQSHEGYLKNKEAVLEKNKQWKLDNPERAKEMRIRAGKKERSTLKGRLNNAMSSNIWHALKGLKAGRRWEALVGYTVEDLKNHLEKHFLKGMSWDNYGTDWEIDHKIPKVAFNYEHPEDIDFRKAWGLKNLQPLWKSANRRKYDKIVKSFQPALLLAEVNNR